MNIKVAGLLILVLTVLLAPCNSAKYIVDKSGEVKITRIERKSLILNYGTFLTPGEYTNIFLKPQTYINPRYVDTGPFDDGCFELYAEFKDDTTIIYEGTYCKSKNLTSKFQLREVPNAFGAKSWLTISNDQTGRYLHIDCMTGR